ncbi:hypothetical protein FJY70_05580, partial [candidate division WOR-3 bacterium]|nr:hypothetical protein [candidate division WOR-3 bacterium]
MNSGESSTHQDHAERLFMLADIEAGLGNISAALAEAKRAVAVGLKSGDTGLAAYSLARQAQFLAALGKHQLARNAGRRCMTLARRAEDKGCVPLAHYIMGQVEFQAGRPALARARYLDALRSTRALGVREG